MNVGATGVTDYGNYYQYGKGSAQFTATSRDSDYSGTEDPLAASADTAAQEWGGNWHIPTRAELRSLITNTNYTWEENFNGSGINGGKFTNKIDTSKYIFIPAAGYYDDSSLYDVGKQGFIWSSTPSGENNAFYLYFMNGWEEVDGTYRKFGYPVRPVLG